MDIGTCGKRFLFMYKVKFWLLSNGPSVFGKGLQIELSFMGRGEVACYL